MSDYVLQDLQDLLSVPFALCFNIFIPVASSPLPYSVFSVLCCVQSCLTGSCSVSLHFRFGNCNIL